MPQIKHLQAREILDSRGRPTVWARCELIGGAVASVSVPSGASTGAAEAWELRDGDPARYRGLGCRRAVANIEGEIQRAVVGRTLTLDGRPGTVIGIVAPAIEVGRFSEIENRPRDHWSEIRETRTRVDALERRRISASAVRSEVARASARFGSGHRN